MREVVKRPAFGGLTKPGLADLGEPHRSAVAEHSRIPLVLVPFCLRAAAMSQHRLQETGTELLGRLAGIPHQAKAERATTLDTVIEMSEPASRLQSEVSGHPDGPRILFDAWKSGVVSDRDLRGLIPDAWTRSGNDQPEQVIGTQDWVEMFRTAGFVSQPTSQIAPVGTLTIYRGAPEQRSRGMAWSTDVIKAEQHRQRCEKFNETALLYTATIEPIGVLALFSSRGEEEVVVDPQFLIDHRLIGPPANRTSGCD